MIRVTFCRFNINLGVANSAALSVAAERHYKDVLATKTELRGALMVGWPVQIVGHAFPNYGICLWWIRIEDLLPIDFTFELSFIIDPIRA